MVDSTPAPVEITWLGQAGFAVLAPGGQVCLLDPYLSDWAYREAGIHRIVPIVRDPHAIEATVVATSHWHEDHHDPDSIKAIAAADPSTVFVGPPANMARCQQWQIARDRTRSLGRGESVIVGPFAVHASFARHDVPGWICEDAISIVVEVAGVRIFHSGDTEYDSRILGALASGPIHVGLFAINGTGGNMNTAEAALLAYRLRPRLAIPMHYGMWADEDYGPGATLDPSEFVDVYRRLSGEEARILVPGETIKVQPT